MEHLLIEVHFLVIVHDLLDDIYEYDNVLSITLGKDVFIIEAIKDAALCNV
jgi:hypothetical protein